MTDTQNRRLAFYESFTEEGRREGADHGKLVVTPYSPNISSLSDEQVKNGWLLLVVDKYGAVYVAAIVTMATLAVASMTIDVYTYLVDQPWTDYLPLVCFAILLPLLWLYSRRNLSKWILSLEKLEHDGQDFYWSEIVGLAIYQAKPKAGSRFVLVTSFFDGSEAVLPISLGKSDMTKMMSGARLFMDMNK